MPSDDKSDKGFFKRKWNPGGGAAAPPVKPALFKPEEMDIYCDRQVGSVYIFHLNKVEYETLDYLEYNPKDYSVDVVLKDGGRMDLGVKIQWLVRPYFTKAPEILVVQTKDRVSIDGVTLRLVHKPKEEKK